MSASLLQTISRNLRYRSQYFYLKSSLSGSDLISNNFGRYQQKRYLDLQEYQAKQLLSEHGVKVQRFKVVSNAKEAKDVLFPEEKHASSNEQNNSLWSGLDVDISRADEFVIKAQVLAGGRGKGQFKNSSLNGGVQLTKSRQEALGIAKDMLNDYIVTKQTTSEGVLVKKVMIAEAVRLVKEFYIAIVLDRSYDGGPIFVTSSRGGMDIEEVAATNEDLIKRFTIPIDIELDYDTAKRMSMVAFELNLHESVVIEQCAREIIRLHSMFIKLDATQIEINPLGVTNDQKVVSVDAKMKFDENARFRHKWVDEVELMNSDEIDKRDIEAKKFNLNFIGLDGTIGCLVNGAGLAMATMDIIKLHGGNPANFLDVGGSATASQVTEAFRIISTDPKVKAIFVNIFGGIMRCDTIAEGIIQAAKTLDLQVPIICRLQGSRVEDARELLKQSGLSILARDDLDEAAELAVKSSGIH